MKGSVNLLDSASKQLITNEARQCWEDMQSMDTIVVTAHRSPDGDAVGSLLGLLNHLREAGLNAKGILPDRYPSFLSWMPGLDEVLIHNENQQVADALLMNADAIWCLDFNGPSRTGSMESTLRNSTAKKWVVDHHQNPEEFANRLFSNPNCGSTCELIFDLILGWEQMEQLSLNVAKCLYTGIMTDTGSFRYASVTEHTHLILAHFLNKGLDHAEIHERVFDQQSLNRVSLQAYAMSSKLRVWMDKGVGMIGLTKDDLERFAYQAGDTEGIVNSILAIEGVQLAIFAKESEGRIKMSLRSVGEINVRDIASEYFNGGGHIHAAGGVFNSDSMDGLVSFIEEKLIGQFH